MTRPLHRPASPAHVRNLNAKQFAALQLLTSSFRCLFIPRNLGGPLGPAKSGTRQVRCTPSIS